MTLYFVSDAAGNDANDGLDNTGIGLATGTWEEATLTLTQNGHGYTFVTGDLIALLAGTGLTPGIYEPISSTINTITFAATSSLRGVGDGNDIAAGDDAAGDWTSSDGPFVTVQQAIDTVAAGDEIHIKGDGLYQEALTNPVVGTLADPIQFWGYTTSITDGGQATIDGNGEAIVSGMDYDGTVTAFHVYNHLRFTNFSSHGFNGIAVTALVFRYCEFDNNGGIGLSAKDDVSLLGCHFHDNDNTGAYINGSGIVVGCLFRNNLNGLGIEGPGSNYVFNCIAAGNTNLGIQVDGGLSTVPNNTVWGNNKDTVTGINLVDPTRAILMNNIVTECGVGITSNNANGWTAKVACTNNLVYDCTTPYNANAATEIGAITVDPLFKGAATGDFTLSAGSPAIGIGAHPANAPNAPTQTGTTEHLGAGGVEVLYPEDYPAVGDVQAGVVYHSGASTGTFTEPGVGNVESGVTYGAGGTEFTGTFTEPGVGNVEAGTKYGAGGTEFTGTFTSPDAGDVKKETTYGADGTEFTGTWFGGSGSGFNHGGRLN